ncbi:YdcF family protein [Palleronia sp.]|uniref:YdcF family protein n=1 Tax=Palleronia sp. TaxID=1940284 RepID=UPI0035C814CB
MILGAAVWTGGAPSPTLRRRCAAAAELWATGGFDRVIPSGGVGRHPPAEADVMAGLLIASGVPPAAIDLERRATRTIETAEHVAGMVSPDARITAVSDRYHLARVWIAFRSQGPVVSLASAHRARPAPRRSVAARAWAREAVGNVAYAAIWFSGYFRR